MKELGNTPADKNYQPSGISRARQKALETYPEDDFYGVCIACREAYQYGYEQAEKDLAMTWEDVKQIVEIADKLCPYTSKNIAEFQQEFQTEEAYYKEVLRRFNEAGGGKNL